MPYLSVVSVGEITIDHYLDLGQTFVGGISLNFAVNCKRAGAEQAALISRVGTADTERVRAKLSAEGVDDSHARVLAGPTAVQAIDVTSDGERIFPPGGYRPGVLDGFVLDDADMEFIRQHNVLACACFRQAEPLFRQALAVPFEGARVADFLDLSDFGGDPQTIARYADRLAIAFVSGDEALVDALRPLSRATSCICVVTHGARGSTALSGGVLARQPAVPVPRVIDTTGCGDAFQAAFTVSYLRDGDIARALNAGATLAAVVAQHYGATG
ncbi:MAG: hypothetical protein HZB53_16065 [Chloroflexi bacterium]|nr:hypothetical protein [Chloroflexota bacterium]